MHFIYNVHTEQVGKITNSMPATNMNSNRIHYNHLIIRLCKKPYKLTLMKLLVDIYINNNSKSMQYKYYLKTIKLNSI